MIMFDISSGNKSRDITDYSIAPTTPKEHNSKYPILFPRGCVFEEEDFQPATYNFKLADEVTEMRTGGMLREIEDDLQKILRNTKAKGQEQRSAEVMQEVEYMAVAIF